MADTTITNDNHRLLRLISLMGWTAPPDENRASVRWPDKGAAERIDQHAGFPLSVKLHRMVANYAGAVHRFRDGVDTTETQLDTRDLPGLALEVLTGIADDALAELGAIVAGELAPGSELDALSIGRMWRDDVIATCWRLLVERHEDKFDE